MAGTRRNRFGSKNVDQSRDPMEAWSRQQHGVESISAETQKLANGAGSIELTKDALKSAVAPLSAMQKKEVAKQLGYESFEALLAASMVMTLDDGSAWCLTRDRSGAWTAWNVCPLDVPGRTKTKEEVIAAIHNGED